MRWACILLVHARMIYYRMKGKEAPATLESTIPGISRNIEPQNRQNISYTSESGRLPSETQPSRLNNRPFLDKLFDAITPRIGM